MFKMHPELMELKSPTSSSFSFDPSNQVHSFSNSVKLMNTHFAEIAKNTDSLDGFDILTNPPFGLNLTEKVSAVKLEQSFSEFDKFLYKRRDTLGEVFVIYPTKVTKGHFHFISESDFEWDIKKEFYSGGFRLGVFAWSRKLKAEKEIMMNPTPESSAIMLPADQKPITYDFMLINKEWKNIAEKKVIMNLRRLRRNEYLKERKEIEDQKKIEAENQRNLQREKKIQKIGNKINQMGITPKEVDLLNQSLQKEVGKKHRKIEKRRAKPNSPKWT